MGVTTHAEMTAAKRLIEAARKVNRLRLELAEAERLQALATKQLERAMKTVGRHEIAVVNG
jgi:hypothetical protein